jgi:4-amino-4-deoxychorismate lyase
MAPGFQLFSSLRYDPILVSAANAKDGESLQYAGPFYMLPYHRDRMLQAAQHFGWTTAASCISGDAGLAHLAAQLSAAVDVQSSRPLRVKALLDQDGNITVETSPISVCVPLSTLFPARLPPPEGGRLTGVPSAAQGVPEMEEPWTVVLDPGRTSPSPETTYKTTSRDMYMDARERSGIKSFDEKKEVLIVSSRDQGIMEGSLTSVYFWRDGRWTTPPVSTGGQMGTTRRWALEKGLCVEGVVKADSLVNGEECWISNGVRGFIWVRVNLS